MLNAIKQRQPFLVLCLLLIFHVALISLQVKNLEGTPLLKVWLINLNAPIIHGIEHSSQNTERLWRRYIYLKGLYDENQTLRREIEHLKLQVWKSEEIAGENKRLAELLILKEQLPYRAEGARVVIKKPSTTSQTIFIDKGLNYGLKPNMPAISAEGIVGRIMSVSQTLAEVQLITNLKASANAAIEARGVQGVIMGTGEDDLQLHYVRADMQVEPGDVVTTFGQDGIYPKGLPIGTVTEVRPSKDIYKYIRVKPATNIWRLADVLLLTN